MKTHVKRTFGVAINILALAVIVFFGILLFFLVINAAI